MHRLFPKLTLAALLLVTSSTALGQKPRDAAANKKIDEAINEHYLATDFKKAEDVLVGTIKACEDKCSDAVLARAWMYVGLVRGSGKQDQAGAQEAFATAVQLDPSVKLDDALATPETKAAFQAAGGGASGGSGGSGGGGTGSGGDSGGGAEKPKPSGGGDEEAVGNMQCSPKQRTIQTRYPIPIHCETEEDASKAELRYKAADGEWKTLPMKKKSGGFQATIPCDATQTAAMMKVYVRAKDSSGDTVDSWGSKSKPIEFELTNEEQDEPPAFPDKDPPDRCPEKEECPPDMPGCEQKRGDKEWGDSCEETTECKEGLACTNGSCETAQACESDADCGDGTGCEAGVCTAGAAKGPPKDHWVGLHAGMDLAWVSGEEVCSEDSQANNGFACFEGETQYDGTPQTGTANQITGGLAPGTFRLLLSYDMVVADPVTVGGRLGYAFGGGPAAGVNKVAFMPFHAEARATYWFMPLSQAGFRAYAHGGAGMAQVDAKLPVSVVDCSEPAAGFNTDTCAASPNTEAGASKRLDAYKKLGQGFVVVGGGAGYAPSADGMIQLNLNLMYMLPTSGLVIEPTLGYVMGF